MFQSELFFYLWCMRWTGVHPQLEKHIHVSQYGIPVQMGLLKVAFIFPIPMEKSSSWGIYHGCTCVFFWHAKFRGWIDGRRPDNNLYHGVGLARKGGVSGRWAEGGVDMMSGLHPDAVCPHEVLSFCPRGSPGWAGCRPAPPEGLPRRHLGPPANPGCGWTSHRRLLALGEKLLGGLRAVMT